MSDQNANEQQHSGQTRTVYQKVKGFVPLRARVFVATRLMKLGDRLTQLNRPLLASKYLRGEGIEIGALHSPLKVNRPTKVKYVDRLTRSELIELYPEVPANDIVKTDILDDGQHLVTIQDSSQDFVIANHFLEHCPNPLGALKNIYRVLKVGGILFMALPDKRYTFDVDRPVTTFDHVLRDFEEGPQWSERQHYEEWVRVIGNLSNEEAERQIEELMAREVWIHFHVWTQYEMFELLANARQKLGLSFEVECFLKADVEGIFVLRKSEPVSDSSSPEYHSNAKKGRDVAGEHITDA